MVTLAMSAEGGARAPQFSAWNATACDGSADEPGRHLNGEANCSTTLDGERCDGRTACVDDGGYVISDEKSPVAARCGDKGATTQKSPDRATERERVAPAVQLKQSGCGTPET